MSGILLFLASIWAWIVSWFDTPYRTITVHEYLPKTLQKRRLYIVEEDGIEEQAAMLCPCGCGRTLHMNLLPDERPRWRHTAHKNGTSSLKPSVWRKKDCGSHFWFREGRVVWCRPTEDGERELVRYG